jgi:hypothetical protein
VILTGREGPVGDTRFATAAYRSRWLWLLCSFQGPPRKRWAGRVDTRADPAGTGLSKLNSMLGLELGGMPRAARDGTATRSCETTAGPGQVRSTF